MEATSASTSTQTVADKAKPNKAGPTSAPSEPTADMTHHANAPNDTPTVEEKHAPPPEELTETVKSEQSTAGQGDLELSQQESLSKQNKTPSQAAVDSAEDLYFTIRETFPTAVSNFESRWATAAQVVRSSAKGDASCKQTDEYMALQRLGPKIIPFIVWKLAKDNTGDSLWAVSLYDDLENDTEYGPILEEDLMICRTRIVELNYQRNQIVERKIAAWEEVHNNNFLMSSTDETTYTEEYEALLKMGTSIIAPLMVAYYRRGASGCYWELLHEMIHGRKMGAVEFQPRALLAQCCLFFNELEHADAPEYIQTPFDRWIENGELVGGYIPGEFYGNPYFQSQWP